ncbi:MAG: hypothetical protein HYZ38_25490 [Mycobacterium sp.]|nr:hypothetical protein [Mycobacterium sp.]
MTERTQDPGHEALGSAGLLLNIAAVIGCAIGLAGVGVTDLAFTAGAFALAALAFVTSVIFLFLDGRRADDRERTAAVPATH